MVCDDLPIQHRNHLPTPESSQQESCSGAGDKHLFGLSGDDHFHTPVDWIFMVYIYIYIHCNYVHTYMMLNTITVICIYICMIIYIYVCVCV